MPTLASPRVLITGASGYLGTALLRHLSLHRPTWEVHATFFTIPPAPGHPSFHALDVRDADSVRRVLDAVHPHVIFHTAALNTGGPQEMYETNARGSEFIARGAAQQRARLIHLSSDVIFDGLKGQYTEDDAPNPITPYAVSKTDAERAVAASGANAVIVRTSLIYGFKPLDPRTRAVLRGEMVKLFVDEWRCPIWVENLCAALVELAEAEYCGVLHVAGTQRLNRYEFGVKLMRILGGDDTRLIPTRLADSRLTRPQDCSLDVSRAQRLLRTKLLGVDQAALLQGSLTGE